MAEGQPQKDGKVICAAHVTVSKRKQEWILATFISEDSNEGKCVVKDLFPGVNQRRIFFTIPISETRVFPAPENVTFSEKDQVLALWYMPEEKEWTSVFFSAVVTGVEKQMLKIRYVGEETDRWVVRDKVVKLKLDGAEKKQKKSEKVAETKEKEVNDAAHNEAPVSAETGGSRLGEEKQDKETDSLKTMSEPQIARLPPKKRMKTL